MNAFHLLSQRFQSLPLIKIIEDCLDTEHKTIVTLIQSQLAEGRRGDNTKMPRYKWTTIQSKKESGTHLIGDRISLIDKGDFWDAMISSTKDGVLMIDSKDWKSEMLVKRYGASIMELAPDSLETVIENIFDLIQSKVYDYLNG